MKLSSIPRFSSTSTSKEKIGRIPPDCNSPNSLFIDRKANRISDKTILEVFAKDLLGTAFFPSEQFVQLTFKDLETYEKYLHNLSFTVKDKTYHLSPPKHIPRSSLTIHLHGLPILPKPTISKAIYDALSEYCNVQDVAPVLIKGTELITPKWDAVVTPISHKQIPVHLNILDSSIALTWINSSKICL
ncbi:6049_t:CDS:2, partial [Paraglomus occultum]